MPAKLQTRVTRPFPPLQKGWQYQTSTGHEGKSPHFMEQVVGSETVSNM